MFLFGLNALIIINVIFAITTIGGFGYGVMLYWVIALISTVNFFAYVIWSIKVVSMGGNQFTSDFNKMEDIAKLILSNIANTTKEERSRRFIYAITRVLIVMICGFLTMDKYPYIVFISTLFSLSYIATQIILYINESKIDYLLSSDEYRTLIKDNIIKSKEFESIENEKIKND